MESGWNQDVFLTAVEEWKTYCWGCESVVFYYNGKHGIYRTEQTEGRNLNGTV